VFITLTRRSPLTGLGWVGHNAGHPPAHIAACKETTVTSSTVAGPLLAYTYHHPDPTASRFCQWQFAISYRSGIKFRFVASSLTLQGRRGYHCIDTAHSQGFASAVVRTVPRAAARVCLLVSDNTSFARIRYRPNGPVECHCTETLKLQMLLASSSSSLCTLYTNKFLHLNQNPKLANVSETIPEGGITRFINKYNMASGGGGAR